MFSSFRLGVYAVGLTAALAAGASAQSDQMRLGGRVGFHANDQHAGVGVQFLAPLFDRVDFYPSGEYYFNLGQWGYTANFDLKWQIPKQPLSLYAGTGVGFRSAAANQVNRPDAGLNLFGGFEPPVGSVNFHTFAELRVYMSHETHVGIAAGLNYAIGKVKR